MNREQFIDRLNEIINPYLEKKNEINKEMDQIKTEKQIRIEQINIEKNTLKLRLERLKENKEDEIKKYIEDSYNSNYNFDYRYLSSLRRELEESYEKTEKQLEQQIKQLDEEEQRLQNLNYSYLIYDKKLPGIRETVRVGLSRLIPQIENSIERKKLELQLVDIDIKEIRYKYASWEAEEAMSSLQPYYNLKQEISNEIRLLEELLQNVRDNYKLTYFDEELNNMLNMDFNQKIIVPVITRKVEELVLEKKEELKPVVPDVIDVIEKNEENIEVQEEAEKEDFPSVAIDTFKEIFDVPLEEEKSDALTFEQIVNKVCMDNLIDETQSLKYKASKIKVFDKDKLEQLSSKNIKSIAKTIVGIIPQAAMKLYGNIVSKDTKNMFLNMESNALKLSDEEVQVLMREYDRNLVPDGFNEIVKPRINLYLSQKVEKLNDDVKFALMEINRCKELINNSNDEFIINNAYEQANLYIKLLISYEVDIDLLLKKSALHSYKEKLKSLNKKLNYAGGRFITAKNTEPELWSRISGLSQKIEYSLDPKEVVNSYFRREDIYKEYNKTSDYVPQIQSTNIEPITTKSSKTSDEIKSTIEDLKAMRAELTEEDKKEIEALLRR